MTQAMCGIKRTLMALIDDPHWLAHCLGVATEILVKCANAQFERGIDAPAIGEGGAGGEGQGNLLPPQMHEQQLLPCHQEMISRISGPTIMHICGDVTPRLTMFKQTAMTCSNFDWAIAAL